ncbi:MAG TPA: hypothetical protein VJX73_09895 [Terracidiphilus sp.]|nr:hypothetical protein [Terracidiphilus sp.]
MGRLTFLGVSPKLDLPVDELVKAVGSSLRDATFFLDTNVLTKKLDPEVWNALCSRRMLITPGVFKELLPWLRKPFCNPAIRDSVVHALRVQVGLERMSQDSTLPKIDVLLVDDEHRRHAYQYYLNLLALRKAMGPWAFAVLTKRLGRDPTQDELVAELQRNLGERALHMAMKGIAANSLPNKLADEELVVLAMLTAILKGSEVFILTRDQDVLEQYFKLTCHIKEHYRATLVAEKYASNPSAMDFREICPTTAELQTSPFEGPSVLQLRTTDAEFNPLRPEHHFVNFYCLLLGGESPNLKATFANFGAETEIAQTLRIKAATNGLDTDRLGGRNCIIETSPLTPQNHEVLVTIGKEKKVTVGEEIEIIFSDLYNTLHSHEQHTNVLYHEPSSSGE